jgi:hypothetical protein
LAGRLFSIDAVDVAVEERKLRCSVFNGSADVDLVALRSERHKRILAQKSNVLPHPPTSQPPTAPLRQRNSTVKMGRLHSNGKGISASAIPYSRTPPAWLKTTPEQVVDQICKLAKKGATPSQIGVVLRDSHGIAQVKVVTGNKILRILKGNGTHPV